VRTSRVFRRPFDLRIPDEPSRQSIVDPGAVELLPESGFDLQAHVKQIERNLR
jgi:hypothetical protein